MSESRESLGSTAQRVSEVASTEICHQYLSLVVLTASSWDRALLEVCDCFRDVHYELFLHRERMTLNGRRSARSLV